MGVRVHAVALVPQDDGNDSRHVIPGTGLAEHDRSGGIDLSPPEVAAALEDVAVDFDPPHKGQGVGLPAGDQGVGATLLEAEGLFVDVLAYDMDVPVFVVREGAAPITPEMVEAAGEDT